MTQSTTERDLIGSWELINWISTKDGKFNTHPMGEDVVGQLIYTAEGRMSGFLMRSDFKDQNPRTPASSAICLSYGGIYHVVGNEVVHDVIMSTIPEWIGGPLIRTMVWQADNLLLKTEPQKAKDGKFYSNELQWKRLTKP